MNERTHLKFSERFTYLRENVEKEKREKIKVL